MAATVGTESSVWFDRWNGPVDTGIDCTSWLDPFLAETGGFDLTVQPTADYPCVPAGMLSAVPHADGSELKIGQVDGTSRGVSFSSEVNIMMKAIQSKQKQSRPASPRMGPATTGHDRHEVDLYQAANNVGKHLCISATSKHMNSFI